MPRTPPFHVLVDATGTFVSPQPGILLAWREGARSWEAWVISAGAYSTGTGVGCVGASEVGACASGAAGGVDADF